MVWVVLGGLIIDEYYVVVLDGFVELCGSEVLGSYVCFNVLG